MKAYDLRLVKRIEVDAVLDDADFNKPYIEVKSVTATKTKITAKLVIDVDSDNGPKRKTVSVSVMARTCSTYPTSGPPIGATSWTTSTPATAMWPSPTA